MQEQCCGCAAVSIPKTRIFPNFRSCTPAGPAESADHWQFSLLQNSAQQRLVQSPWKAAPKLKAAPHAGNAGFRYNAGVSTGTILAALSITTSIAARHKLIPLSPMREALPGSMASEAISAPLR